MRGLILALVMASSMMFSEGCALTQLLGGQPGLGGNPLGGLNPGQLGGIPQAQIPLQGPIAQSLPLSPGGTQVAPQGVGPLAAAPGVAQPAFQPAAPLAPATTPVAGTAAGLPAAPASPPANTPSGVQPPPPAVTPVAQPTTPQPGPPGIGTV